MMQYIQMIGPTVLGIFNGHGKGTRLKPHLERVDLTQEAPRDGVFLDSTTGDCYKWDPARHDPKLPSRGWRREHNLGLIHHPSRAAPPAMPHSTMTDPLSDSTTTVVQREAQAMSHWIFKGNSTNKFVAPCTREWDMQQRPGHHELRVLASSMRGVEIVQDARERFMGTMFSFDPLFKGTTIVLHNFVRHTFDTMRDAAEFKGEWYAWMLGNAEGGMLNLEFPAPFKPYNQPTTCAPRSPVLLKTTQRSWGVPDSTMRSSLRNAATATDRCHRSRMTARSVADTHRAEQAANFAQQANRWDLRHRKARTIQQVLKANRSKLGTATTPPAMKGSNWGCLLYTSPSPRDRTRSRMPSSA
eukprot:TRINITY_DN3317_c0_g2_i2.p1 TRINITY_DN3317_c0_g2~~TRINITY_DN3317_c0_g2_i2.p1  ORF type:complete len:357 (-),score=85.94 TRINITY_DN3317_c0_g2_i2:2-1072(-)